MDRRKDFLQGMRDGIPIALGYLAVAFTLGIACRNVGMGAVQASVMSATNLTSAGEFAALGIMARDADNRDIDPVLRQIGESVSEGRHLSESIAETGVFPAYVTELLNIGEQTGRLEEVCGALARYYEEEDDLRESIRSAVSYPSGCACARSASLRPCRTARPCNAPPPPPSCAA